MHSLLKRQIKKHLPEELVNGQVLESFFAAISKSYSDFDEKLKMIQRATVLSSEELYEANLRLNQETESQRKVLKALSRAVASMQHEGGNRENGEFKLDHQKLVEDIEKQAHRLVEITEEKDILLKNLEQQNESLNNYAHMVSHDLKSPIRNVHSLVSWVFEDGKENFNEQSNQNIDLIFQNLTKMDSLIDGILRHSSIDSLQEQPVVLDLYDLLDEIEQTIYVPENITIKKSKNLPKLFTGKYRMEQLFKNLITNAITACGDKTDGCVGIDVQKEKDGWLFTVTDNGKGIPKHLQVGIFDMFKKLENNSSATGIGLALVKKIINYYKGDIWLSSSEERGTTFFFTIKKEL
ncbi:sensor histidine kinase [Flagellimonas allohymeniacidonis]|uniref:histidine kinase n=1 Tax=Flagellimonas allohymeniacidonis TaxID=2517819 RepID=A0A4Q8QBY9_9FLAO|nr:HAMP domain-containing sensor histidine kinase [Allomuricauda hymeniacidonis]TAI47164.1 HAMP domain-containing histidine kinase [Allomuricauda hymeniacidonis]